MRVRDVVVFYAQLINKYLIISCMYLCLRYARFCQSCTKLQFPSFKEKKKTKRQKEKQKQRNFLPLSKLNNPLIHSFDVLSDKKPCWKLEFGVVSVQNGILYRRGLISTTYNNNNENNYTTLRDMCTILQVYHKIQYVSWY